MRNNLTMIGNRYFTGLTSLESLHLKSNKIAAIEPEALLPLTNLEFLDLSFNMKLIMTDERELMKNFCSTRVLNN